MSLFDAVAYAIGEAAAWVAGRIIGRAFSLPPERAQALGEWLLVSVIVLAAVGITLIYSMR